MILGVFGERPHEAPTHGLEAIRGRVQVCRSRPTVPEMHDRLAAPGGRASEAFTLIELLAFLGYSSAVSVL